MSLETQGKGSLKTQSDLAMEASGNGKLSGMQLALEGKSKSELKGAQVSVNGSGQVEVKSSGITQVQGSMVKIN
jgi:type VI secretion system secreted protein VgrG